MDPISLSLSDLFQHIVHIGMDVFPPISLQDERTKLSVFFDEASRRWEHLFQRQTMSITEFKISADFSAGRGSPAKATLETFQLTNRGPILLFPLLLFPPIGDTRLSDTYIETFHEIRELLFKRLPDHKIMRIGLVRQLLFQTGKQPCTSLLSASAEFGTAKLIEGNRLLVYRDESCNIRLTIQPVGLQKEVRMQVGANVVQERMHGLQVVFDVNNHEIKPLEQTEIEGVIDKALQLWPGPLLEFINGGLNDDN